MKKRFAAVIAAAVFALSPAAKAATSPIILINGTYAGNETMATIRNNTTYVSLRSISEHLNPDGVITWKNNTATIKTKDMTLTAIEGDKYLIVNGEKIHISH